MRKMFLASTMLLACSVAASAADVTKPVLITKTPQIGAYPTTKCGVYVGLAGEGTAAKVDNVAPGTISTGGAIGALAGYACPTASFPWFIEGIAAWQNIGTSDGQFSANAPFHGEIRAGVQTDLLQLIPQVLPGTGAISGLPTPTPPVLPPGAVANGPAVNYVYGAMNFDDLSSQFGATTARDWLFSPEIGTGILTPVKLANGKPIVVDTGLGMELQTNSFCLGQFTCPKLGTRWKVFGAVKF